MSRRVTLGANRVTLAQGFGCETIAEGVEDGETLKLLEDFGVDYAQGYHLGRPAPLQHITVLTETA
jgi:Amt family ammonium transporter